MIAVLLLPVLLAPLLVQASGDQAELAVNSLAGASAHLAAESATHVGTVRLTATFTSIGVELPFDGDANSSSTALLEFRPAGEDTWRQGLPLWRTADPAGAAFYGSALLLDAGAEYDVRVTVADPDGVTGEAQQVAAIMTRADDIPAPETLTPTHYVRADGDDKNTGQTPATAWRTLDQAFRNAPAGAVVQVGPGFYAVAGRAAKPSPAVRTRPLTLLAEYPAVDADHQPINAGQRSVIESAGVTSPAGAADGPNPGVWRQVTLTGPKSGRTFAVWHWADSTVPDAMQLGYAETRAATPLRVAHWAQDKGDLASAAGWAEKLYTNLTYNWGFYSQGPDLYLRLPGDLDPNSLYITASEPSQPGLSINGPDVRISGFEVRQFSSGINVLSSATRAIVDHNLLTGNADGVSFRGDRRAAGESAGQPPSYGSDHVVQDNLILDSNLHLAGLGAAVEGSHIPWMFIKAKIREADGTEYAVNRIGGQSESNGVSGRGGALRVVVRRNTIDGPFNGVSPGYNEGFDRYAGQDMDVHDNLLRHQADDALEPELATINFRAWNNRIEQALTVLSTGPVNFGPVYLFRNTALEIGNNGVPADGQGRTPGSAMLKYSGKSAPTALVYVLHNTFWTDHFTDGGAQFASTGASPEAFYLRNNVIRTARYAFEAPREPANWDENCNYFATTDTSRGLSFSGSVYRGNVQAYRDASGQGGCTNVSEGFVSDVPLMDPAAGDLRLPPGSPLVDAGVPVPNLSDRAGLDYQGARPDIGAFEQQP
ncbi:MAG: hypothetical protein AB7P40_06570 [Chloroflexota bacterium]